MKRTWVTLALGALLTVSCSSSDYGEAELALETTYIIGNANTVWATIANPINDMWRDMVQLPNAPFKPAAGSGVHDRWYIDNGGYHLSNGQGNLNMLTFRIWLVQATTSPPVPAYWAASADVWKADATGHTYLSTNVVTVTAWPSWEFALSWQDGLLDFAVFDTLGRWAMEQSYPLTFTAGPAVTNIRSPEVDFTLDNGANGCRNDMLGAADTATGTGYYYVETWAGNDTEFLQAEIAAPTTNPKCSLRTVSYPGDNDTINWTMPVFN